MVQFSHPCMITGKTIALTVWTFFGKVMSLFFNTLSRFVIAFLPSSKHLWILWLQSQSTVILELNKIKSVTVSFFSSFSCHKVMGPDAMIFVFKMFSFKPAFSLSSFTFIKKFFSSSSLSAIRVVWSAYLRLLIFFLAIFISTGSHPPWKFSCCTRKLNKQGDHIQPWHTPFPVLNQYLF